MGIFVACCAALSDWTVHWEQVLLKAVGQNISLHSSVIGLNMGSQENLTADPQAEPYTPSRVSATVHSVSSKPAQ